MAKTEEKKRKQEKRGKKEKNLHNTNKKWRPHHVGRTKISSVMSLPKIAEEIFFMISQSRKKGKERGRKKEKKKKGTKQNGKFFSHCNFSRKSRHSGRAPGAKIEKKSAYVGRNECRRYLVEDWR